MFGNKNIARDQFSTGQVSKSAVSENFNFHYDLCELFDLSIGDVKKQVVD